MSFSMSPHVRKTRTWWYFIIILLYLVWSWYVTLLVYRIICPLDEIFIVIRSTRCWLFSFFTLLALPVLCNSWSWLVVALLAFLHLLSFRISRSFVRSFHPHAQVKQAQQQTNQFARMGCAVICHLHNICMLFPDFDLGINLIWIVCE